MAGGALNQGRARAGPVLADDQVRLRYPGFPIRIRAHQSTASQQWGFAPIIGFLAHPAARGQANAVLDERLLGVVRVDRLVANR